MSLPAFNRRLGPDPRLRLVTWLAGAGWAVMFVLFLVLQLARPEMADIFTRMSGVAVRTSWHPLWGPVALGLGVALLVTGSLGVALNATRLRRRRDHLHAGIVSLLLLATALTLWLFFVV